MENNKYISLVILLACTMRNNFPVAQLVEHWSFLLSSCREMSG